MHEKKIFSLIFSPIILSDTPIDKSQKCQFISKSGCIWGMLKSNKNINNSTVATT